MQGTGGMLHQAGVQAPQDSAHSAGGSPVACKRQAPAARCSGTWSTAELASGCCWLLLRGTHHEGRRRGPWRRRGRRPHRHIARRPRVLVTASAHGGGAAERAPEVALGPHRHIPVEAAEAAQAAGGVDLIGSSDAGGGRRHAGSCSGGGRRRRGRWAQRAGGCQSGGGGVKARAGPTKHAMSHPGQAAQAGLPPQPLRPPWASTQEQQQRHPPPL